MLNINQLNIDINFALEEHLKHITNFVENRLNENLDTSSNEYECNEILKNFITSTTDNVNHIVGADHKELRLINSRFKTYIDSQSAFSGISYDEYIGTKLNQKPSKGKIHIFFKRLEHVFSYKTFGDKNYSKYKLTENLKVRTCIYCNRMYAVTQYKSDGNNLMNPQLDHWLPKSKYPLLQISFYNLIPSCDICNTRIKKIREFIEDEHVHPYDEKYDEIKFTFQFKTNINDYRIEFENDGKTLNKVRDTFQYLFVDEMYNSHIPELKDLIKIKEVYGDCYLSKLNELFPDLKISDKDRYRLAFGVELDPKNFHLYPLSKFKFDILKELGII